MTGQFADLHIHSYYSDGTMSPREILSEAEKRGVGLLAISDHDVADGSRELMKISRDSSVKCVPAVEVTASDRGRQVHVLAYNFDLDDSAFLSFISDGRHKLNEMSVRLVEKLQADGKNVSPEDFEVFEGDRTKGGWKALHYFLARGVTEKLKDGMPLYAFYGCGYEKAGFPDVETAITKIHAAGGKAVIAHPGVSLGESIIGDLTRFMSYGADGVECYYSEHSPEITALLLNYCENNGLLITCGSDCHGSFLTKQIGVPEVKITALRLGGII